MTTTTTAKKIIIKEFILDLIQEGKLDDVSVFLGDICKLLNDEQVEEFLKKYS